MGSSLLGGRHSLKLRLVLRTWAGHSTADSLLQAISLGEGSVRILFAHQNFPGQYKNLLMHLAGERGHELVFLTQRQNASLPGVKQVVYRPTRKPTDATHPYLRNFEAAVLNGQAVWRAAKKLKAEGFRPDILIGHNGWGETLLL